MKDILMFLSSVQSSPTYNLPTGFSIRMFDHDNNDHLTWAEIEVAAGEFSDVQNALEKFSSWTQELPDEISKRCLFLVDQSNQKDIGTITAWEGAGEYANLGRVHWVAIIPEYQGRGLAKPLLSSALHLMKGKYDEAYLKTYDSKSKAIALYESFGFTQKGPNAHLI